MLAVSLGLVIAASVVQLMASNQTADRLNRALASVQESGRFIIARLRAELLLVGRYDPLVANFNPAADIAEEAAFVHSRAIAVPGDFPQRAALGSQAAAGSESDVLVVVLQTTRDCRGYKLGYQQTEEFVVVNQYFVDQHKLKCRGFDMRVLRGQKPPVDNNKDAAFTLLDNVVNVQVLYGITANRDTGDDSGRPVRYITADKIAAQRLLGSVVVAMRIALVLRSDNYAQIEPSATFRLLNDAIHTPVSNHLHTLFETTIALRNRRNAAKLRADTQANLRYLIHSIHSADDIYLGDEA